MTYPGPMFIKTMHPRRGVVRKRVDIDKSGVFVPKLHILDHRTDRAFIIPESQWHRYSDHAEILDRGMVHQVHRVERSVVPKDTDPDEDAVNDMDGRV